MSITQTTVPFTARDLAIIAPHLCGAEAAMLRKKVVATADADLACAFVIHFPRMHTAALDQIVARGADAAILRLYARSAPGSDLNLFIQTILDRADGIEIHLFGAYVPGVDSAWADAQADRLDPTWRMRFDQMMQ